MEVQVSVNTGGLVAVSVFNWKVISPRIVTWPVEGNVKCGKAMLLIYIQTYYRL